MRGVEIEKYWRKNAFLWNTSFLTFLFRFCIIVLGKSFATANVVGCEFY